jgi:4'-phosphopantetheinyl transferase EntD
MFLGDALVRRVDEAQDTYEQKHQPRETKRGEKRERKYLTAHINAQQLISSTVIQVSAIMFHHGVTRNEQF